MGKRKEPKGERAPAAPAQPPPPPRLGDHSAYMPEPLLPLADDHIKVKEGSTLPAHNMTLVLYCGAPARSSELFVGASSERPAALSAPFDEHAEADVARFLKCLYSSANSTTRGEDAALPAVVRLAHALNAAPVLVAAQRRWVKHVRRGAPVIKIAEAATLATLCGWEDVRAKGPASLFHWLQAPLGAAATPAQQALNDVDAFDYASDVIDDCPPDLAARAFGTLAATFWRLHAKASAAARDSALSPAAAAAAALAEIACIWHAVADLSPAAFRDRAAGWVAYDVAALFVRILEVNDPAPGEAAAANEARRAAALYMQPRRRGGQRGESLRASLNIA